MAELSEHRAGIPALANKTYFNYGGQGTIPQQAIAAVTAAFHHVQEIGPFSTPMFDWITEQIIETREDLATELGGKSECYALTANATEGCNMVLWGIEWKHGDHLLISDSEHGGVVAAAENISIRLGLHLDYFAVAEKTDEQVLEAMTSAIGPRTKLVLFSHVLWNTGQELPVEEMTAVAHAAGAQVLVDAAQSAGAVNVDLTLSGVDYYAITGHKWLCGPEGAGALYIREDRLTELQPTFVGWRKDMTGLYAKRPVDGSRFEVATSAFPLLAGLRSALAFHWSFGSSGERTNALLANARTLRSALESVGGIHLFGGEPKSGLVSFTIPGISNSSLVADLERQKLILRTIPSPDAVRASVHYFTTSEEIFRLADALAKVRV